MRDRDDLNFCLKYMKLINNVRERHVSKTKNTFPL